MPGTVLSAILHNLIITPFEAGTFFFFKIICFMYEKAKSLMILSLHG